MMYPGIKKYQGGHNHDIGEHPDREQYPGHHVENDHRYESNRPCLRVQQKKGNGQVV